jgi:hypothetical protein
MQDDPRGSAIADTERSSIENERKLTRRLHGRRRSFFPRVIEGGVIAIVAAGLWGAANLDRNSTAGALFSQAIPNAAQPEEALAQAPRPNAPPSSQVAAPSTAPDSVAVTMVPLPQTKSPASTEVNSPLVIQAAAAEVVSAPVEAALPAAPLPKEEVRSGPPATQGLQSAVPSQAAQIVQPTNGPTNSQVDSYLRRARELIGLGDVAAARLMLSRAAEGKDSRALVALAETYDPVVLRNWRVVGMRPDPDKARALYEEALEKGSKTAGEHLLAMK